MKQLNFLLDDQLSNDQSLEVDVMRFVAIIGIIFWIIFAMIKSIPFTNTQAKTIETIPDLVTADKIILKKVSTLGSELKPEIKPEPVPEPMPRAKPMSETKVILKTISESKTESEPNPVQENRQGLHLQFQSMEDLVAMLRNKKAKTYCRAVNNGFDLIFEGYMSDSFFKFKSAADIPVKMWELKNGDDREYFIRELSRTIPDVKTFNLLKVMVSFSDSHFDSKVETMLAELNQEKKDGILSVSSGGQIKFHEFKSNKDSKKKKFLEGSDEKN